MPHKCTRCGKIYTEKDEKILRGCDCGNRMFLYYRKLGKGEAKKLEKGARKVKSRALSKMVKDIEVGGEKSQTLPELGNIKVSEGIYSIDVASLMSGEPVIVEGSEGEYLLSLSSLFEEKSTQKKYMDILRK